MLLSFLPYAHIILTHSLTHSVLSLGLPPRRPRFVPSPRSTKTLPTTLRNPSIWATTQTRRRFGVWLLDDVEEKLEFDWVLGGVQDFSGAEVHSIEFSVPFLSPPMYTFQVILARTHDHTSLPSQSHRPLPSTLRSESVVSVFFYSLMPALSTALSLPPAQTGRHSSRARRAGS